jgi:hypothetical protein
MAYILQAFVADAPIIQAGVPTGAEFVLLNQGKAMIPITDELREFYEIPFCPLTDQVKEIPAGICSLAKKIPGKTAYLEAEFFGGIGSQAAAIWDMGNLIFGPVVKACAINEALQKLNVVKGDSHDEFEALGLGRHRGTNSWTKTKTS